MDKFITLTVITTGEDLTDRFNIHQPLKSVFNRAVQVVGGGSNKDQFTLEFKDEPLDLERKLEDFIAQFGWQDGTTLELLPRPEVVS